MQAGTDDKKKDCGRATSCISFGLAGEERAVQYLRSIGYEVRERNVRLGRGEIDIVAFDTHEKMIVFVEVKTRSSHSDAYPIHSALDTRKRKALRTTIALWANAHTYQGPGRIDLISVQDSVIVEHLIDIGSDFY